VNARCENLFNCCETKPDQSQQKHATGSKRGKTPICPLGMMSFGFAAWMTEKERNTSMFAFVGKNR